MQIVVVAKQEVIREGLVQLLSKSFSVCGRPLHAPLPEDEEADLVLLVVGGLETAGTIAQAQESYPESKLLVFLLSENASTALSVLRSHVHGIVDQSCSEQELVDCIRQVAEGEFAISRQLARSLAQLHGSQDLLDRTLLVGSNLTPRELDVLRLLAEGFTNKGIAARLSLSEHTVRAHLRGIMQKLQVTNRVQAAALAWQDKRPRQEARGEYPRRRR